MRLFTIRVNLLITLFVFLSTSAYSQAKIGNKAPAFMIENVYKCDIDSFNLEMLRGKIVILDFWATWCKYCVQRFPEYNKLSQKYSKDSVLFIGITDDSIERLESFLDNNQIDFCIGQDIDKSIFRNYNVRLRPYIIIINRNGDVIYRGNHLYEQHIKEALKTNTINSKKP